ncbi:sugar ABC transporter substrate-binding protein [Streptomyces sp. NPDC051940]|uniref:ABC transporter substrate-binding protein n=1 Tax=Streptomyces sp. NPDC051940 TaxID=3155675 RepID=UPI0034190953
MTRRRRTRGRGSRAAAALLALAALSLATACGSDGGDSSDGAAAGGKVTLDFWGWAPGYDKSVELWNKSHPDVQVRFQKVQSGAGGGYAKMQNAVKAGNAPCLAQVGNETLPTFLVTGALQDITEYAAEGEDQFVDWTWRQSGFDGKVYGIPVDTGPTALFYRTDLFEKYGIAVPGTWDEFAAAARKVHDADPSVRLINSLTDAYDTAGYVWQAGGHWFGTANDQWQVTMDGPETRKVTAYWQDLQEDDLLYTADGPLGQAWFNDAKKGKVLSLITAAWAAPLLQTNLPDLAGKWAVAPMPQWTAGEKASGNNGGSTTAVLKGCEHAKEATEFARWFSTDTGSVTNLIKNTGIYPAAKAGLGLPAVNEPSPYYGGQNTYEVFRAAAENTSPDWVWGPTMNQVESDFVDGLKKAKGGGSTVPEVAATVQDKTVAAMKDQGLSVTS